MLKGRGRDPRGAVPPTPTPSHHNMRPPAISHNAPARPPLTPQMNRAQFVKPEPDYEVVEFPSEQYVNAKLQPPPPPPPRPPTGKYTNLHLISVISLLYKDRYGHRLKGTLIHNIH